jgi:hypothetical protein
MEVKEKVWHEEIWEVMRDARKKAKKMSPEEVISLKKETEKEIRRIFSEQTPHEEISADRVGRAKKRENTEFKKKYELVLKQIERLEAEQTATLAIVQDHRTHIIHPTKSLGTSEATAIAIASDWHIEEEVRSESVNNKNKYTLDIAKKRADKFFQKIVSLTRKEQQDVTINNLVLALLGDFTSGNIHPELLAICSLPPAKAILEAQGFLQSGIEFLLNNTKLNLIIPCHVGNHSRITQKVYISSEQGNSLEYGMYHSLKMRFAGEPRVRFIIAEGYHSFLDVYDTKIRFHHGHMMKYQGGVGGLTIPVNKAIAQWNKETRVDMDVFGHWHTYMPLKNFVANGSLIGYNAFAVSIKADYDVPKQAYFLVDKKLGPSIFAPIFVA